jgi:predicted ATPase
VENPNLFVLTGGPGAGKTTVLMELARLGFAHVPEVARQIIQEQMAAGGRALPWGDREEYTRVMLQRSIDSFVEHTPVSKITFADRGIPDTLCYARLIGFGEETAIQQACATYRYARRAFLAPPWREIYATDGERKQDFEEAEQTYRLMKEVYAECGYEICELPKASPNDRAKFIVERLP